MKNPITSLFRHIFRREAAAAQSGQASAGCAAPRQGGVLYLGGGTPLAVAAVYRCVKLLSETVANLPLRYMERRTGGVFAEAADSDLHYLLTVQPTPEYSAVDFWAQAVQQMLLEGNAYIVPVVNPVTLAFERLALCQRGTVSHDTRSGTYYVNDTVSGVSGTYGEADIIHLKNLSLDGLHGLSVLSFARQTTDIAGAGGNETLNRFQNGGNVRGIISNDTSVRGFGEYQDAELDATAQALDEYVQQNRRFVALPGQVKLSPFSLTSQDMQFLESRKFTVREICRFFGVHPSFVFDDTSNNYKSAEMANVAFLSNTLNPMLRKIENELHRKLIPRKFCCRRRFEFDRRSLYACDLAAKIDYQTKTIAAGLYTVNEWREAENLPRVEGGDTPLVSANLRNLTEAATAAEPTDTNTDKAK